MIVEISYEVRSNTTRIFTILQAAADLQDCTLSGVDKVTY